MIEKCCVHAWYVEKTDHIQYTPVSYTHLEVQQLQYFLSIISESYPSIPSVTIDSRFGPGLDRSVRAFQREFGLAVDGLVGRYTWNSIYETYAAIVGW